MAGGNNDSDFIGFISNNINVLNQIDHAVARDFGLPPYPSFHDLLGFDWHTSSSGYPEPPTRPKSNVVRGPQRLSTVQGNQDHQRHHSNCERPVRNMSVPPTSSMRQKNHDLQGHCELGQVSVLEKSLSTGRNNQYHPGHTISVKGVSNMPKPQSPTMGQGSQHSQNHFNPVRTTNSVCEPQKQSMGKNNQNHKGHNDIYVRRVSIAPSSQALSMAQDSQLSQNHSNPIPFTSSIREPRRLSTCKSNQDHQVSAPVEAVSSMPAPQRRLSTGQPNQDHQGRATSVKALGNMPPPRRPMRPGSQDPRHHAASARNCSTLSMPMSQSPSIGQGDQHPWQAAAQPTSTALAGSRDVLERKEDVRHQQSDSQNAAIVQNHPPATRRLYPLPRLPLSHRTSNMTTSRPPLNNMETPVTNSQSFRYDRVAFSRQVDPAIRTTNVSQAPAISNLDHGVNEYLNTWQYINADRQNDITDIGGTAGIPAVKRGVTGGVKLQKRKRNDDDEIEGLKPSVASAEETTAAKRQRLEVTGNSRELPGFPSSKDPLPADWTLELIVTVYPNHTLVPCVLDAFTQYFWTGGDIYKSFSPEVCQAWNQVFPNQGANALHKRLISRWRKMGIPSLTSLLKSPKAVRCFNNGTVYFGKSNPGNLDLNPRAPKKPVKKE